MNAPNKPRQQGDDVRCPGTSWQDLLDLEEVPVPAYLIVHPRGRVLFFGGLPQGTTHVEFPSNVLHYREVQVHGSYASRHRDQVAALDMLAADAGGIRSVVSDVIGLDDTPDAFPRIRAGEALKVVVTP